MMSSMRMFQGLRLSGKLFQRSKTPVFKRTFLSQAYQCQEAWDKRMDSELLQEINPIEFFMEIDQKFQGEHRVFSIDIDLFANVIKDASHAPEIIDVLHKLRMTRDSSWTMPSTHHAVVRYFLSINKADELLILLNDRLNYGLFCDYFDYNLLMNYFIKKNDFASAAKAATYMMLQEEFEHPISNAMAIYSCFKYLETPDSWQEVDPKTLVDEPKEEVKVRVKYIRNPYFDDHFDLWQPSDLVGKTLYWIGEKIGGPVGRSCHLRGLVLYKKYKEAISLIKQWKKEDTKIVVYKDLLPLIKKDAPEIFVTDAGDTSDDAKELKILLTEFESADLYQGELLGDIMKMIEKAIETHAQNDISTQTKLYIEWEEKRIKVLQEQIDELDRYQRMQNVENIKKELIEKERLITFFENEEQIEVQIEEKLKREKQLYGDVTEVEEVTDENYVSPDVLRNTNKK